MTNPDAPTEAESERNGFLSYSAEWHAAAHGFFDGMKTWRARPGELPEDNEDVQKEPHYYKGAYVIGTVFQLGIVVGFGNAVV